LQAGERVTATGRDVDALRDALVHDRDRLTCVAVDVRDREQVVRAVQEAMEAMGTIDVLLNNAGYSQMGIFEEVSAEAFEDQYATNLFGALNVLRAVLPVMRRARSGHVINVASLNGVVALRGSSAYSSTKSALIGVSEALAPEVAPLGIKVTAVCPGAVRTDFLDENSMRWIEEPIADYAELAQAVRGRYEEMNHNQPGDPDRVARAIVALSRREQAPMRLMLGSAAYDVAHDFYAARLAELEADEVTARAADFEPVAP
jgi:NAD(P)-dependent dehydrogenase (short-subunit alcohol dehydrogenase family)